MKKLLILATFVSTNALAAPYTLLLESNKQYNKVLVKDTKAEVNVEVIQLNPLSAKNNQKINKLLMNSVLDMVTMSDEESQNFYMEGTETVLEVNKDYLTTVSTGSSYTGGAHPNHYNTVVTLDLNKAATVKEDDFSSAYIKFEDVIAENSITTAEKEFKSLLLKKINSEETCADVEMTTDDIWLGATALTSKSVIINSEFPHAYAVCNTSVEVPYSTVQSMLKPGSLAEKLAKAAKK